MHGAPLSKSQKIIAALLKKFTRSHESLLTVHMVRTVHFKLNIGAVLYSSGCKEVA